MFAFIRLILFGSTLIFLFPQIIFQCHDKTSCTRHALIVLRRWPREDQENLSACF